MACNKNINEILNVDFSSGNDEFNWLNNTNTSIETIDGQLRLIPESITSRFTRSLGVLDPTNNRIRLQANLDVFRPQTSTQSTFCAKFEIFIGSQLIDVYSLYLENLVAGETVEYNLDRVYKYSELTGTISLKITTVEGWENVMLLDYLKCDDFNYCDDNVRNYFVLDSFFADSFGSVSSAVQLLEWKVDGVETLTPEFFSENNTPGGNPIADWLFAKANIDGSERVSDVADPNTFNPFISEFGLNYDVANYYDGKPISTVTGSDYGSGIMQIGFEKPSILNGLLNEVDGAFFIDIDYTKNLKVVFNVLVNNTNANVFNSPAIYRKFTVLWNVATCEGKFYFNDVLNNNEFNDQDDNGFLSGITGTQTTIETVGCDELFTYNGNAGTYEYLINFGTEIGLCGISFNAYSQPDKFEIEWNGQTYSSGYVGSSLYDQQLINLGIPQSEINTGSPSTGIGNLFINKDQASPSTALIRVTAPLSGTAWNITGICPDGGVPNEPPTVEITSDTPSVQQGVSQEFQIVSNDTDGTIESYLVTWGDGGTVSSNSAPPATLNHTFNTLGSKTITITVVDNDGAIGTDTLIVNVDGTISWTATGTVNNTCSSAGTGAFTVFGGSLPIYNRFVLNSGVVVSQDAVITNTVTLDVVNIPGGEFREFLPGNYTFEIPAIDCSAGTGFNQIHLNQTTFP